MDNDTFLRFTQLRQNLDHLRSAYKVSIRHVLQCSGLLEVYSYGKLYNNLYQGRGEFPVEALDSLELTISELSLEFASRPNMARLTDNRHAFARKAYATAVSMASRVEALERKVESLERAERQRLYREAAEHEAGEWGTLD